MARAAASRRGMTAIIARFAVPLLAITATLLSGSKASVLPATNVTAKGTQMPVGDPQMAINIQVSHAMATWAGMNTIELQNHLMSLFNNLTSPESIQGQYSVAPPTKEGAPSTLHTKMQFDSRKTVADAMKAVAHDLLTIGNAIKAVVPCGSTIDITATGSLVKKPRLTLSCGTAKTKVTAKSKAVSMPELCCHAATRSLLSSASVDIPSAGQCPYSTGMVIYCSISYQYYVINNGNALVFSPAAYLRAGGPLPSFTTSLCTATVVNGCGVTGSVTGSTVSKVPTSPTVTWNSIPSPNSLGSSQILASANGNYFFQIQNSGYTTELPRFTCYKWSSQDTKRIKGGSPEWSTCRVKSTTLSGTTFAYVYTEGNNKLFPGCGGCSCCQPLTAPNAVLALSATPSTVLSAASAAVRYWSWPFWAPNGISTVSLTMQSGGNLVLWDTTVGASTQMWSTPTPGEGTGPYTLVMQSNGALNIKNIFMVTIWSSQTYWVGPANGVLNNGWAMVQSGPTSTDPPKLWGGGPAAPAPGSVMLPSGSIVQCQDMYGNFTTTYFAAANSQGAVTMRPFTAQGFLLAGNPGITYLAPPAWCGTSSVAGITISRAPIPGLLEGQINGGYMQLKGSNGCLTVSTSAVDQIFWGGSNNGGVYTCPTTTGLASTLVSYIVDDSSGTPYFRLVPQNANSCGIAVTGSCSGTPSLVALNTCNAPTNPAEQFVFQYSNASSSSSQSSTASTGQAFTIASYSCPGMCLTNPKLSFVDKTVPTLAPCNPTDPAQAFQTAPTVTISSSFRTYTPQYLTFTDTGLIGKLVGAVMLASNSSTGAQVSLGTSISFKSQDGNGAPGTVTVAFASSPIGGPGAVPLDTLRRAWAGVMISQFGQGNQVGTIPSNTYLQAGESYVSSLITFTATPPPNAPTTCKKSQTPWFKIAIGIASLAAGVVTGGASFAAEATIATAVELAYSAGELVVGAVGIANAAC